MIVCLDSGNSRIKWGVHDGAAWLEQGAVRHDDGAMLTDLVARWPKPTQLLLANVAGTGAAARIRERLGPWGPWLQEVHSEPQRAGVTNLYRHPERLGVDRWCALIGARARTTVPCLVVMAGTATTIDTLDGEGCFCGGLILPGSDLMRASLARDTAGLPLAHGNWTAMPRCTEDAIVTGVLEAKVGAIERAFARLDSPSAICLVSGGNAGILLPHLSIPCVEVPNLPLEGLLRIALEHEENA